MFKFILLVASLAYASAGHAGSYANYAPAAAVSYSTVTRTHSHPVAHGNDHSVLHHGYTHPHYNHHVYGHNFAPAHSYEQGYAQYLSNDHYGHSHHGAPLTAAKHVTVAHVPVHHHNAYAGNLVAAPVLAAHGYNYGGAHHLGYNHHQGHHAY